MARPGPQPKATPKHGHSGAGWIDYINTPYTGPGSDMELPATPGVQWFGQVEGWWEQIRQMPHCADWAPTDWIFAIETALFKQNMYSEFFGGTIHATMITEIRRREDQMGTTVEARRKLGIRYVDPAQVTQEETDAPGADETTPGNSQPGSDGVRPIGSAKSRRQQLAG
jgi:hypothetical protein